MSFSLKKAVSPGATIFSYASGLTDRRYVRRESSNRSSDIILKAEGERISNSMQIPASMYGAYDEVISLFAFCICSLA